MANYYNSCKCHISGDTGIDKSTAYNKHSEAECAERNVDISDIQMQMIHYIPDLHCLENRFLMPIPCTDHKWQQLTHFWVIVILHPTIREPFTPQCHNLGRNTSSNYIQKHTFEDHYIKYILFSSFQDNYLVKL